jgi:hypothetical protein
MSPRDAKLAEISRVMRSLAAETSGEAYRLLHEYWIVVLCAKDGPAPDGPKETVRVPRAIAPASSADQLGGAQASVKPPPPQPPEFKSWLNDVIKGDGTGPGLEPA